MLTKGIGWFSKLREASRVLIVVMDFDIWCRVLQVEEAIARSFGGSHERINSADLKKRSGCSSSLDGKLEWGFFAS